MTERLQDNSNTPEPNGRPEEDIAGRDRLVSNVVFSWAAHFVFIAAGFIMPRMIDRRLGQDLLGVWDFAWSLVSYFELVQAGVGSSVNRYVAKYRAAGDYTSVSRAVSSALCVLSVAGLIILALTIGVSVLLGPFFGERLGENLVEAQWVVFFLGVCVAAQVAFGPFHGVLTGCHRWGLTNMIRSGWHAVTIAAMILALVLGRRLPTLAIIMLVGQLLADATRMVAVHRVCRDLRVRVTLIQWRMARRLLYFGGKTLIPGISHLLVNQTTYVLIMVYLGPAAVALYARPRSLIFQMRVLVAKMAFVLTPTTSSMQSMDDLEGIRELLIKSVRYAFYMVLPMMLLIAIFGDAIMHFWMGPGYANHLIPAILAVGSIAVASQQPVYNILSGLNAHGRLGIALFVCSLSSLGLMFLMLGPFEWGLAGVAIAVMLPVTIMHVVYLPTLVCRRIGLSTRRYLLSVTAQPVLCTLPFIACLVIARLTFPGRPLRGLAWGGSAGSVVLAIVYWRHVLPDRIRSKLMGMVGIRGARSHAALS